MAKVVPGNNAPGSVPRSKGAFLIRDTKHGPVGAKWPRSRPGGPKTPYDFYRQTEFGMAARMASSMGALQYETAVELTKGSEQLPRDYLMQCIMGTAYIIEFADGTVWDSARYMTNNPQYILDLITTDPGSMLYRADIGWIGIPAGLNGQVLTQTPSGPAWQAGGGGGGGGVLPVDYWTRTLTSVTGAGTAANGNAFRVYEDFYADQVHAIVNAAASRPFSLWLAKMSGEGTSATIDELHQAAAVTPATVVAGRPIPLYATLSAPVQLQAGEIWTMGSVRTDGAGTANAEQVYQNTVSVAAPWPAQRLAYVQAALNALDVGDTFSVWNTSFAASMANGLRWGLGSIPA